MDQTANQRFHFEVDEAFNRQHNEYSRDTRRLQTGAGVLAGVLVIALILLLVLGGVGGATILLAIVCGVFAIISAVMVFVIPKQVGAPQDMYDRYPLVPAVVAKVNPHDVELLALVNRAVDPQEPPRWALALRTISSVPGTKRSVGERIPSVAVSVRRAVRDARNWDEINPMPIGWATQDTEVLKKARQAIPENLWQKLNKHIEDRAKVADTKYNLLPLEALK